MEKRTIQDQTTLPVFLWADEAQNFLHEHDAEYQATARSSRIATVYISQNLPNYYASMGGQEAGNRVKSFLGTLGTKIFHANADIDTNQYASTLIGDKSTKKESDGTSFGKEVNLSFNRHYEFERAVRPEQFMRLKSGGYSNHGKVDGIMVWQGNTVIQDRSHAKVAFSQDFR
ncbi:MAG: TraM recognition domain-containing protein [Hymenobacter sp.]